MKLTTVSFSTTFLCALFSSALAVPVSTSPAKAFPLPKAEIPVSTFTKDGRQTQSIIKATIKPTEAFSTLGVHDPEVSRTRTDIAQQTQDPTAGHPKALPKGLGKIDDATPATLVEPTPEPTALLVAADADTPSPVEKRQTPTSNIFGAPIATTSPPSVFSRRTTHPQPRQNILDTGVPVQTNKFYANLFLGRRDHQVFSYPYSLWWANGDNRINGIVDSTWGFAVSHIEDWQKEDDDASFAWDAPGATDYYYTPLWFKSIQFSATQFTKASSSMDVDSAGEFSIGVNLYQNKASYPSTKKVRLNLCLGMGLVSARYTDLTPTFDTDIKFLSIVRDVITAPAGIVKYIITLQDGMKWALYAKADPNAGTDQAPFVLTITDEKKLTASGPFTGLIQLGKLNYYNPSASEAAYDLSAGAECLGAVVTGQVAGDVGTYQINYQKNSDATTPLLMYSLIHHYESFEPETAAQLQANVQLTSPTKGMMKAVLADTWKLKETGLPVDIKWLPVKSGNPVQWSTANKQRLIDITVKDLKEDMMNITYNEQLYFAGKSLAKYAQLCLVCNDVIANVSLTQPCITNLKAAYGKFLANTNSKIPNKLVYDYTWYGLVSDTVWKTGDVYADFGLSHYNDHHFQYGYFVYTAAVIAYIDKAVSGNSNWYNSNKAFVETFIRDYANPNAADRYFPVSRSFDYFHGHSWAKGLFESQDGKDEESSAEDVFSAYAIKMWGAISGNTAMEARGNLMLGIMKRSLNHYMLLDPTTNVVHPEKFALNRVSGILWEAKAAHQVHWDGGNTPRMVQGMHMIPPNPVSGYIKKASHVIDEWNTYFSGRTGNINDGWKGILYANYALYDPVASFNFMKQSYWLASWVDGGATRSWYVAFAGMLGGAA